ncbi:MAG: SDR family oxidoreductase [Spirochaetales bacterium]|nr:SDR family oxidoreductase [Spirochaetales bacterium]
MNVFVTGGSRGIGRAIVLKMAQEGRNVAFTYRNNKDEADATIRLVSQSNADVTVAAHRLDVKSSEQVENVVSTVLDDFGKIDAVVNNAAILRNNAAALMSDEEWDEVIAANLSGPFYVIRAFLMHFIAERFGRIINISSLAQDGASGQINYAASKAGLIGLTKSIAREYGPKGISCNIVTVGLVETDMVRDNLAEQLSEVWLQYCPMKRLGTPEEISSLVHYLTTPEAGFINGEVIRVSGGLTYVP